MPDTSGAVILLRLLQSLVAGGTSWKSAASEEGLNLADLLIRSLSGKIPSARALADDSVGGVAAGAGIPSLTSSVLSTLLDGQGGRSAPVLSFLASGLAGSLLGFLSGSDAPDSPSPRVPFAPPPPIAVEAGIGTTGRAAPLDYSYDGSPRTIPANAPPPVPSVVVNVQAMDSRSFLDHSDDIARAVREALLNSHPLGGYLAE